MNDNLYSSEGHEISLETNLKIIGYLRAKACKDGWLTENSKAIPSSIIDKVASVLPTFGAFQPRIHCMPDGYLSLLYADVNNNTIDILVRDRPEAIVVTRSPSKLHPDRKVIKRVVKKPEELAGFVTAFYEN